ncbi:hypothetical protein E4N62_39685 [Streptomyces sp. MNU76]|uniref:hypothetical protein n=1 Tax=Streptomyces sp. MNU76 TaxID=2560026 RepID=UPI001E47D80A|nr:hypothetical protein [Streptomyces sp. MNU76]MCC9710822.1 hypothetical protein [Streptomyces sp. MNU76]
MKYRYRPQYFAEVWRPGEPSLVIPLACKGNHSDSATSAEQLASTSAHAEAVATPLPLVATAVERTDV